MIVGGMVGVVVGRARDVGVCVPSWAEAIATKATRATATRSFIAKLE